MENPIFISEPTKSYTALILLFLFFLGLGIFVYRLQTQKMKIENSGFRQMLILVSGLISMVLFVTALFTAYHLFTIQPIRLYDTYLTCYYDKIPYQDIKRVGIYKDNQTSFVNPMITIRKDEMLVIEKNDDKTYLFHADNFDLMPLVKMIKEKTEGK